jgi:cyanophycinase
VEETRRKDPIFEVITTATNLSEEVGEDYLSAFDELGVHDSGTIHVEEREKAADFESRIEKCDGVLFSGGNQLKLTTILGGTRFMEIIKDRYMNDKNFVVAGTSAGAAAMSSTMIVSGSSRDALIKGQLQLNTGLGFIGSLFIDTHFTQRGRFGRLLQTIAVNPSVMGLGLSEDTGAVIYDGMDVEIIGSGIAVFVDGSSIKYTNLTEIPDGDPITVEGFEVHVLSKGKRFFLDERRLAKEKK